MGIVRRGSMSGLMVDAENFVRTVVRLFPRAERPRVEDACRRISTKVSAWLGGQLLLAGIIGGTAALGLFLLLIVEDSPD